MTTWLGDDDERTEAEAEESEDDEYERGQADRSRPGYFAIRPEILRTALKAIDANSDNAAQAEAQIQSADVLIPQDNNRWHQEFGKTDGQIWANALQPVSGNAQQGQRRSARIANRAGLGSTTGTKEQVTKEPVAGKPVVSGPVVRSRLKIISLPNEILRTVVEQIPDQNTLILFALACKTFAATAFKVYSTNDMMWVFNDWEGFRKDYDCNRSSFLLSQPVADWMPLHLKYCRHCDQWSGAFDGAHRKKGEYDDLVHPCLWCRYRKDEHRHHFHPQECEDLDTCARYSDWYQGSPKKEKKWAANAWHPDLADSDDDVKSFRGSEEDDDEDMDDEDDEDRDSDEEEEEEEDEAYRRELKCAMCKAGLTCGRH